MVRPVNIEVINLSVWNMERLAEFWVIVKPALLNPEIARKMDCHHGSSISEKNTKRMENSMNPINCRMTIRITSFIANAPTPPNLENSFPEVSRNINRRWLSETRCPNSVNRNVASVIKPSPPKNIKTKIIVCPNLVQYVGVSTTVSPVTVTADVAVKIAVIIGYPES